MEKLFPLSVKNFVTALGIKYSHSNSNIAITIEINKYYFSLQISYLIDDEASNDSKRGCIIVSMNYHFLKTHRFGITYVYFHAENYIGQNKNGYVMIYFMLRIFTGLCT